MSPTSVSPTTIMIVAEKRLSAKADITPAFDSVRDLLLSKWDHLPPEAQALITLTVNVTVPERVPVQ